MSGQNPHGRLGQPLNAAWNHLQVPSFIPRQPQLAHMSNERPLMGTPLGWPPVHSAEALYGYMAAAAASAASAASGKGPSLDLNALHPAFARAPNNLPFGSVDLSLSSASRNSISPAPCGPIPSSMTTSTPIMNKQQHELQAIQNNNSKSPIPTDLENSVPTCQTPNSSSSSEQSNPLLNVGNGSLLPAALLTMLAAKSQASTPSTPPPPNSAIEQINAKQHTGGLYIRDAMQINNDFSKLAGVVAAAASEAMAPKEFTDPMDVMRGMNYLSAKPFIDASINEGTPMPFQPLLSNKILEQNSLSRPNETPTPPPFLGMPSHSLPQNLSELSKSLLSMISNGAVSGSLTQALPSQLNLQPPAPLVQLTKPSLCGDLNVHQPIRTSPRKNNSMTSTDDSHDDSSISGTQQRKSRYRRRKPKKTQRLSCENSMGSPMDNDDMDIDDSIVKSLNETEIESNNIRRNAEQFLNAAITTKPLLSETNTMNFEDVIPLTKTKIPHINGKEKIDSYVRSINEIAPKTFNTKELGISLNNSTCSNLGKSIDCDIDNIAEIVAKTVSASENKPFIHIPSSNSAVNPVNSVIDMDCNNGIRSDGTRLEEDQLLMPQAEVKIPTTSSPIPPADTKSLGESIETNIRAESEYKSFETELTPTKSITVDAETIDSSQNDGTKQDDKGLENKNDSERKSTEQEGRNDHSQTESGAANSNINASTANVSTNNQRKPSSKSSKKSGKKNGGGTNGKGKNKGSTKKKGHPIKTKSNDKEKKTKTKEDIVASEALKFRGPYVHVDTDGSETVINAPITEEVAEKQSKLKKNLPGLIANDRNRIRGLYVSTLSNKYDSATTDKSWMCVFCKLGPHKYSLGDLFGPYILSITDEDYELSQIEPSDDMFRSNRTRTTILQSRGIIIGAAKAATIPIVNGDLGKPALGKGRKRKNTEPEPSSSVSSPSSSTVKEPSDIYRGMTKVSDDSYEVWVHEDCVVWSPGVHIIGVRIVGLKAAVWGSTRYKCVECSEYGAILSCLHRGCLANAHVPCAKRSNWTLNESEFKSWCNAHNKETVVQAN